MKKILRISIIAIVALGAIFACFKLELFGLNLEFLNRKPLSIEKTANVVEEVKKIGEFTSACYYEEMALRDTYTDKTLIFKHKNEILLIGKGTVRAGFDLSKLQEDDIFVNGDTLKINLPQAEIFDIIMNPSDFTTEYEKGTWSHELTKPIKERARTELEQNAIKSGLLEKAETTGIVRLTNLFKTFGFNEVVITVKESNTETEE
ncbi:MAG: DUF4230 domain-containing protein [Bacteroidales bacterium]|nr:DUF4230 domain-containing protein [Bacteroidales bacterium]